MITIVEEEPLAPHTTLGVGGRARFFVTCVSATEVTEALAYAKEKNLPLAILGGGSNTLIPDEGFDGLVLKVAIDGIEFTKESGSTLVTAGAGVSWGRVVQEACERDLWGIENLAGIPGLVGGAVVQNIGAYGAELSKTFEWAEAVSLTSGAVTRVPRAGAALAYRSSIFKTNRTLIVTRSALRLAHTGTPLLGYPDLKKAVERGELLTTPREIAAAITKIRSAKFPTDGGSAGSFFKNPIITKESAAVLKQKFPELLLLPFNDTHVKVSLAWILDHVLSLKGYARGSVRLYEAQPLVFVALPGATAREVDALASEVKERVHEITGLVIEREVETMRAW